MLRFSSGTRSVAIASPHARAKTNFAAAPAPQHFQEKLQNFDVPPGLGHILAPSKKPVSTQEEAVRVGMIAQDCLDACSKSEHILGVHHNGQPFTVLVGFDSFE